MSNFPQSTTQPDWQEPYSVYSLQSTEGRFHHQQEHHVRLNTSIAEDAHKVQQVTESRRPQEHGQENRQGSNFPAPGNDNLQPPPTGNAASVEQQNQSAHLQHEAPPPNPGPQSAPDLVANPSSDVQVKRERAMESRDFQRFNSKDREEEEMDEDMEDEEMVDASDDGRPEPQTAAEKAERIAEKKKMKRFRLTHQQTRFLMSEFAKQPHPDAAHRERLSREIPGQSPRQVQVWFQNRRAKIKRMNADDRERMMRMRAVPDDFDNVQALHSPYGATNHGLSTPMHSPIDYVQPNYGDPSMMRPMMTVDTIRRQHSNEHLSPTATTGLSPSFGMVGFGQQGPMGASMISPVSVDSNEFYRGHPSPGSSGPRTGIPFAARQNSLDSSYQMQQRPPPQRIMPLQIRETMSRSRSESLQSPLRSSMSWTGDSLDYANYQPGPSSSPGSSLQHRSTYHPEQPRSNPSTGNPFDASSQSSTGLQTPSSHITYPPAQTSTNSEAMSRLRASSSAFPPNLDLRTSMQYRALPAQQTSTQRLPHTARASSFAASAFSSGFQSAPLTAPVDFQLPRTPANLPREYEASQMSAPMAPPQDFGAAYNHGSSPGDATQRQHMHQGSHQAGEEQHQQQIHSAGFLRPEEYAAEERRKRSYTMPGYQNH